MDKREIINEQEDDILDDKGFSFMYNLTIACGIGTVIMFVLGAALYITVLS